MAGFWIPWEVGLTRKPEIFAIAKKLNVSRREAAAMCMEVWEWAQDHSVNGLFAQMQPADISEAVSICGLGEAMAASGWLVVSETCVQFPNWDRYNGKAAKDKFLTAARVRHHRRQKALNKAHHRDGA